MAGAPALQEAVEVCPGEGVKVAPFVDDLMGADLWMLLGEGCFQAAEVVV